MTFGRLDTERSGTQKPWEKPWKCLMEEIANVEAFLELFGCLENCKVMIILVYIPNSRPSFPQKDKIDSD